MSNVYRSGLLTSLAAGYLATAAILAPAGALEPRDDIAALVASIQAATLRFENVEVALAEGFVPDPSGHCVSAAAEGLPTEWGAMGIHYLRPDLLGITATEPRVDGVGLHTDFLNPSILLYEPQADGSLVLVGVENLVFEAAWRRAGNTDAPSLAGRNWDNMADDPATPGDEAHGFEPHWDQHVWFRPNPLGPLHPFNPNVTCEHHASAHSRHHGAHD
ncbi:hypothetical protein [Pararhodobacter sp. SW119]|uniref:hypothetical protein n=1 Tax=Pararhodobacter sp. SW119 TaxID=2780075 RepID=UPI001FD81D6F|nr:hypothetical protein [Pararhodobacter sp. SW119]